ncbi:MAG: 3'-5' exonuclease, partial [Pseudomonadota bacterium]
MIYAFGRLEDDRTFLIRDFDQRPHFLIPAEFADAVKSGTVEPDHRLSLAGESLARVSVVLPSDAPGVRDALHGMGIATYEADVRFAMRYLIDRNVRGGVEILGDALQASSGGDQGVDLIFDNPQIAPADVTVAPRVLSFDIETNPHTDRLLAIACYGCGVDEVVVVTDPDRQMPERTIAVADERGALRYFCDLVRRLDVDVLTGWNVIDFDLNFLQRVAQRVRFDLQLGRHPGTVRIREAQGYFGSGHATIPGRLVLDGLDLLRGAFVKMDEYSLGAVASVVLGEGKTIASHGQDKVDDILRSYAEDLAAFAFYARTDARLALQIIERLDLVDLALRGQRL